MMTPTQQHNNKMSVKISLEHFNTLEKELAFMKEQKDFADKRLTDMKAKNVALARRVGDANALKESAIKKATIYQSKYDELDDEMTLIKAEKDTMVDAWNVAVKKGQGFETALREEKVKYNSLVAELELSKAKCASLAEKECQEEEFVKPVRISKIIWNRQSFLVDDDGNIYTDTGICGVGPPIGKWNAETKTCSWYVKMLVIDKSIQTVIALD
jgi:hypothetical protein